jgi:hypothetical protein
MMKIIISVFLMKIREVCFMGNLKEILLIIAGLALTAPSFAVSTTDLTQGVTPERLVAELIDTSKSKIAYSNIRYQGANNAAGMFIDGMADGLGIDSGIILSSGSISNAIGPNKCYKTTTINKQMGDSHLNAIGGSTYDAAVLEFDFVPEGDRLEFNYVFASEEYQEWTNTQFNDVFGFFLNGNNIALIPNTKTPVAINSVHSTSWGAKANPEFYRDNNYPHPWNMMEYNGEPCKPGTDTPFRTEFDGFTTVLTAFAEVKEGQTYHIKLAVADRGDYSLDSAVFIQGKSFKSIKPPPAAILKSPTGTISDNTPTYTWQSVSTATHYHLVVKNASGNVVLINKLYATTDTQCASGTGTCSITPNVELTDGGYKWSIKTSNQSGDGPLSNTMTFTVNTLPLGATLVSPNGTLDFNRGITYTWNAVPTATQYLLQVNDVTGPVISQWYSAAQAGCANGTSTCSITPDIEIAEGDAQWRIQTANPSGHGPLSDPMLFTIELPPPPPPPLVTICKLYAVHDENRNDSKFLVVEPENNTVTNLGARYVAYDIEALDADPKNGQLYAASGKDAQSGAGTLYKVDSSNGTLTEVGPITLDDGSEVIDISSLSFNPMTNTLWGWAQGIGLFKVIDIEAEPVTAQLRWTSKKKFEGITWNHDGTALILAQNNQVLRYDGIEMTPLCSLADGKIEALEMALDGSLLLAKHGDNVIYTYDPTQINEDGTCPLEVANLPATPYEDIEGMAQVCITVELGNEN